MVKKICFLSTHAYPLFNSYEKSAHGGCEVQLYTIAKELAKDDNLDVNFIVGNFGQKKYEYYDGVTVIRSFNPKSSGASILEKGILSLRYFWTLVRVNPDVCITSSANSTVGLVGFYCMLFRKKHMHRTANIIDVNGYWISRNGFLGKVYKFGLERADEIVCQTVDQQKALRKNHGRQAKLFRNVFDFENLSPHEKKDYVLWVGRANRIKRAEIFLDLARLNPGINFVMIFNRQDEKYFEEISSQANKIPNLEFIEKVPFDKIQKFYDEAKVFVSTSEFEGFANTFIQSGIGRTPIISLDANPDNFIQKYKCGYFAQGSIAKLNKSLNMLFAYDKKYEEMSENIFNYVKEKYDIRKNIKVLKKLV